MFLGDVIVDDDDEDDDACFVGNDALDTDGDGVDGVDVPDRGVCCGNNAPYLFVIHSFIHDRRDLK
jgi:hypothetical protein